MIVLDKTLWESNHIIKLHCTSEWNSPDTSILCDCIYSELKILLTEAKESNKPAYFICDCTKGELPPFSIALKFAKFMTTIRPILHGGLECTILYIKSESAILWFNRIFSIYTPARPVHIINDKNDIKKYIINDKKY